MNHSAIYNKGLVPEACPYWDSSVVFKSPFRYQGIIGFFFKNLARIPAPSANPALQATWAARWLLSLADPWMPVSWFLWKYYIAEVCFIPVGGKGLKWQKVDTVVAPATTRRRLVDTSPWSSIEMQSTVSKLLRHFSSSFNSFILLSTVSTTRRNKRSCKYLFKNGQSL